MAAAVGVPRVDVLSDIDNLRLDDRGGGGSLGNGGGGSDHEGFLGRGRSGLLGRAAAAAAGLSRAALEFGGGGGGRRRRGSRSLGRRRLIIIATSITTAKIEIQVLSKGAELGLRVVPFDVRHLRGLLGVVDVEDGAVLVVDSGFESAALASSLQVETIRTARAILQIACAVDERHIKIVALVARSKVQLVLQLSDVFSTARVLLGDLDRNTAVGSVPHGFLINVASVQFQGRVRTATQLLVD